MRNDKESKSNLLDFILNELGEQDAESGRIYVMVQLVFEPGAASHSGALRKAGEIGPGIYAIGSPMQPSDKVPERLRKPVFLEQFFCASAVQRVIPMPKIEEPSSIVSPH